METAEQIKNFWVSRNFDKILNSKETHQLTESSEERVADPLYVICQKLK